MAKMAKWRRHTVEFKRQVVERMKTCENIQSLARELKLERKLLYTWKYQFEGRPEPRHADLGTTAEERKAFICVHLWPNGFCLTGSPKTAVASKSNC